jgi:hypothetical protein
MPAELAGLIPLVSLLSVDDKLLFFSDTQMRSYWQEDMKWLAEFRCQTPSKIRKQERLAELASRQ